ncbi:MAG: hypothetical protein KF857_05645 [Fimbriimonadaceae bacterium]|nr:hypothetical protein [Fimbriimonadaceae bacterium]
MSSSSPRILRGAGELPKFVDALKPIGILGGHVGRVSRLELEISQLRENAVNEGRAAGYSDGYQDGFDVGRSEGYDIAKGSYETEVAAVRERLGQIVAVAERSVDEWHAAAAEHYAGVALEIARRAIGAELQLSRESVLELAKEALAELRHGTTVRLRVNPGDAEMVATNRAMIMQAVAGIKDVEIVADESVAAGCQVESEFGLVDARVETFLDRIAQEARSA